MTQFEDEDVVNLMRDGMGNMVAHGLNVFGDGPVCTMQDRMSRLLQSAYMIGIARTLLVFAAADQIKGNNPTATLMHILDTYRQSFPDANSCPSAISTITAETATKMLLHYKKERENAQAQPPSSTQH